MGIITTNWVLDAIIFIALTILSVYIYTSRNYNYWKKVGVRHLAPSFLFGNIAPCIFAKETVDSFLLKVYKIGEEEKLIGFYAFDKPYLMVRDPELIRHIFIKDFNNFSNKMLSSNEDDILGSSNIFLAKNPPWKHIRQKLTPAFTSGKLKKMFELMLEICQDFHSYFATLKIDDKVGKPVEIKELTAKLMTDIIGTTAFGMKFNSLTNPHAEFRKYGREMFRSTYKRYLQMLAIFFLPPLRTFTNAKFFDEQGSNFLRTTFWNVINERNKSGIKRSDIIDILIDIKNQQEKDDSNEYKLEGDALVAQAAVFFSGGFETSSTTSSFGLYELSKNLEIQTKLRNDILEALEKTNGKITYEMVTTLPYLDMIVHEALRMYPVLSWIDRLPENDYKFPGTNITVKKGIPLILPMRAMHFNPKYFSNPEKFDPDRFSDENKRNITPFTYFPFGEGPRNCIGGRLGLIQVKLAIINVISKYEITPCKQTPIPMKLDRLNVLTHAAGGLYLNFRKLTN